MEFSTSIWQINKQIAYFCAKFTRMEFIAMEAIMLIII